MVDSIKPLPVALAAVLSGDKLLLIKRIRGAYPGLFGLPGGKIEPGEHIHEAAVRELAEETGLKCKFLRLLGIVSELVFGENSNDSQKKRPIHHFLLFICLLKPVNGMDSITKLDEGESMWFGRDELKKIKDGIIPSDWEIIKTMVTEIPGQNIKPDVEFHGRIPYFLCEMNLKNRRYILKRFVKADGN